MNENVDTLKAAPQAPAPGGFGGGGLALNRKTPLQFGCDPLQNARKPSDGEPTPPEPAPALKRVLEAFRSDLGPAAEELQRVLALPEAEMREACKDLADRLPDLLPADPAMAAILAEELAGAFAEAVGEIGEQGKDGEVVANSGHPYAKCPGCGKFMSPNGHCENCDFTEDDDRMIARGKRALEKARTGKPVTVKDAMYKPGLGSIDFVLGWRGKGEGQVHGHGLKKIEGKHLEDIEAIPETIVKGKLVRLEKQDTGTFDPDRMSIIHGSRIATVRKLNGGNRWELATHWSSESSARNLEEAEKRIAASSGKGG